MYNDQDYSILYNKAVLPSYMLGLAFTHMWKPLTSFHHFNRTGPLKLI